MIKVKYKPGFTLIELLITISILLVLLGVGIAQYEVYNRRNNLILTANSLKSFIEAARSDAAGQGSDLSIQSDFSRLSLVVDSSGKVINEYRNLADGSRYKDASNQVYIFNSFVISDKIKSLTPGTLLTIATPGGQYLINNSPINLVIGSERVSLTINENSISQTQSGF